MLEPQVLIPQLRVELRRDKLALNGLTARDVNQVIETALNGVVVSEVLDGQRTFDLVVRFDKQDRENLDVLRRLPIELPEGGTVPLESVANIYEAGGPEYDQP
jgi:Cu/Ag efflux pump CusA